MASESVGGVHVTADSITYIGAIAPESVGEVQVTDSITYRGAIAPEPVGDVQVTDSITYNGATAPESVGDVQVTESITYSGASAPESVGDVQVTADSITYRSASAPVPVGDVQVTEAGPPADVESSSRWADLQDDESYESYESEDPPPGGTAPLEVQVEEASRRWAEWGLKRGPPPTPAPSPPPSPPAAARLHDGPAGRHAGFGDAGWLAVWMDLSVAKTGPDAARQIATEALQVAVEVEATQYSRKQKCMEAQITVRAASGRATFSVTGRGISGARARRSAYAKVLHYLAGQVGEELLQACREREMEVSQQENLRDIINQHLYELSHDEPD